LTILSRPRSSKTLLHHHPARNPEDSSERAVSVSTSSYDVDEAQEDSTSVIHRIVGLVLELRRAHIGKYMLDFQFMSDVFWSRVVFVFVQNLQCRCATSSMMIPMLNLRGDAL
jgi:hypothetical protein